MFFFFHGILPNKQTQKTWLFRLEFLDFSWKLLSLRKIEDTFSTALITVMCVESVNLTVDGSEIRRENHLGCIKPCKQWDIHYQPQLVNAGFLNHQQYVKIGRCNFGDVKEIMSRERFWTPKLIINR